jgi:hypothetical protein
MSEIRDSQPGNPPPETSALTGAFVSTLSSTRVDGQTYCKVQDERSGTVQLPRLQRRMVRRRKLLRQRSDPAVLRVVPSQRTIRLLVWTQTSSELPSASCEIHGAGHMAVGTLGSESWWINLLETYCEKAVSIYASVLGQTSRYRTRPHYSQEP